MTDINERDIRLLDGNVLLVFLGLMRHGKATVVADEMGLTQPAISHALKRLRSLFDDPLFLRKSQGLEPTAKARSLEPEIRRVVRLLTDSLSGHRDFDPASSELTLRIAGFDYELATLLPHIMALATGTGPKISIRSLALSSSEALEALLHGRIDLGVGFFETLPSGGNISPFESEDLYSEEYVVVGREGHQLFASSIDVAGYVDIPHLLVTSSETVKGLVDYSLDAMGLNRNVQAIVPMFFPALSMLEHSDMIATLPRKVAEMYSTRFKLRYEPLPFKSPTFAVRAVWHRRDSGSEVHSWLLNMLKSHHTKAVIRRQI